MLNLLRQRPWAAAMLALAAAFAVLATSCAGGGRRTALIPLQIEGAAFVGNDACRDCHAEQFRTYDASPHARVHFDHHRLPGGTSCESCHGPGSRHVEAPWNRAGLIINPGKKPEACFTCHLEQGAQFRMPSHHPVLEGRMGCVDCHDPHGAAIFKPARGLAMAQLNEPCLHCHREQQHVFVFEHEAMREGCVQCHHPHGSINRQLLTERDANLCLKCHAQVQGGPGAIIIGRTDHTSFLRQGTCWSAGCHTAVHGSNFNPKLLY